MESIHPYNAFSNLSYNTFLLGSYMTQSRKYRWTSHIMSTNYPYNFTKTVLSFGIPYQRYSPSTSKMAMYQFSAASIMSDYANTYMDTLGDAAYYFMIYWRWGLLSAHAQPFILPYFFYLMNVIIRKACFFSSLEMLSGFTFDNTLMS